MTCLFARVALSIAIVSSCNFCCAQSVTVSGRVVVERAAAAGSSKQNRNSDNSNVVVWLTSGEPGQGIASAPVNRQQRLSLTQKDKTFTPALLVVPVGSSIEFPNRDPLFHNVFSLFSGRRFDLGLYEAGSSRSVKFDREGVSYIFCNIHPEMHAVVIALGTPFFGVSNEVGVFAIPDVPPGRYLRHVWYERATPAFLYSLDELITISGRSELPPIQVREAPELSAQHKNKFGKDYDRTPQTSLY